MNQGLKIHDQSKPHYLTFTIVEWMDIFTEKWARQIVIDSLKYCQEEKGLVIYAFVIMPTHMHLIVSSDTDNLSNTIRDMKRHTSKAIADFMIGKSNKRFQWYMDVFREQAKNHQRNKDYQVWMHHNHPVELYSNKFIWQKLNYIHYNPVEAGLVEYPEEYLYSSARVYADKPGVLEVVQIARQMKTIG